MILFLQYGFDAFVVKRDQCCEELCFVPFISNAYGRMCSDVSVCICATCERFPAHVASVFGLIYSLFISLLVFMILHALVFARDKRFPRS